MRLKIISERIEEIQREKELFENVRYFLNKIKGLGSIEELGDYKDLLISVNTIINEKDKKYKSTLSEQIYWSKKVKTIKFIAVLLLAIALVSSLLLQYLQKSNSSVVIIFITLFTLNMLLLFKEYEIKVINIFYFLLITIVIFTIYYFVPNIRIYVDSYSGTITLCSFLLYITSLFIKIE